MHVLYSPHSLVLTDIDIKAMGTEVTEGALPLQIQSSGICYLSILRWSNTNKCYQVIRENRLLTDEQFYQVSTDMVCDTVNNLLLHFKNN